MSETDGLHMENNREDTHTSKHWRQASEKHAASPSELFKSWPPWKDAPILSSVLPLSYLFQKIL